MVAVAIPGGQFPVPNGAVPCEGTKVFPFNLDFTAGKNAYSIDLTSQYNQKQFTTLQTVYIDNSNNPAILQIVCSVTGQVITAPALSQGYYAILQPSPPKLIAQTLGGVVVLIQLLNFYIPPVVWEIPIVNAAGLPEIDIPALDAVIVGGRVQVQQVPYTIQGLTDASGTIAVGGTRQVLFAASPTRQRWILSNPDTATETLYFCFTLITAGLIPILPGASWDESGSSIVGDGVWVVGATTAHAFTAYFK